MKPPFLACNDNRVWPDSSFIKNKKLKPLIACSSNQQQRDWSSGLPSDILSSIIDRLDDINDYVRFGAVCTHWHAIFRNEISSSKRPSCCRLPLLLVALPPPDLNNQHRALYSLSQNKLCNFRMSVPRHKTCRGSSFGWLVTLEEKAPHHFQIQLLNPFQNRVIDLPPPDNIVQQYLGDSQGGWSGCFLEKAVLSSDPCSSPADFVVMAIMSCHQRLAFFKAGDTTWTSIGDSSHRFPREDRMVVDVIFSHKTNQFYALYSSGAVAAIDLLGLLEGGNPKFTLIAPRPKDLIFPTYLVEDLSSSDLLVVYKDVADRIDNSEAEREHAFPFPFETSTSVKSKLVIQFDVLKLDTSHGIWTRVDNLGENVMFVGCNTSFLRPSSDCPGCEPNSIYYTDDDVNFARLNFDSYGLPDDGIYNLKNGTVRPHYSSERFPDIDVIPLDPFESAAPSPMEYLPQPIWIEPTLKRFS